MGEDIRRDGITPEGIKVRGFYRVQITEKDKLIGDSGWHENVVVNLGFNQYLVSTLGAIAGSKQVTHVALGTGGIPAVTDTALAGELVDSANSRSAVTAATSSNSKTARFTATFASSQSFVTASRNISNVALFNTSAVTVGTLFAGNTYASSAVATNQAVNITYDIVFA